MGCWIDVAHEDGREPEILEMPVQKDFSPGVSCIVQAGCPPKMFAAGRGKEGIHIAEPWAPNGAGGTGLSQSREWEQVLNRLLDRGTRR